MPNMVNSTSLFFTEIQPFFRENPQFPKFHLSAGMPRQAIRARCGNKRYIYARYRYIFKFRFNALMSELKIES